MPFKIAREVKLRDLEHNMDTSRLNIVSENDKERIVKYQKAKEIILNAIKKDEINQIFNDSEKNDNTNNVIK